MTIRHYMSNVKPFDGIENVVAQAASFSGLRVEYHPYPMPKNKRWPSPRSREGYAGDNYRPDPSHGSISTLDTTLDHSQFWDHYHKLRTHADRGEGCS